jgi:hypothetical protein
VSIPWSSCGIGRRLPLSENSKHLWLENSLGRFEGLKRIGAFSSGFVAKVKPQKTPPMQRFLKLFEPYPQWFYRCFDRIVINGYLSFLTPGSEDMN